MDIKKLPKNYQEVIKLTIADLAILDKENAERVLKHIEDLPDDMKILTDFLCNPINVYHEYKKEPSSKNLIKFKDEKKLIVSEQFHLNYKHTNPEGVGVLSSNSLMGVTLVVRRNQQIISKEGNAATHSVVRSVNGQAAGDSAVGVLSDTEITTLSQHGADNILKELMGPASQNLTSKAEMKKGLTLNGVISLKELSNASEDNLTLKWIDSELKDMGFDSDLLAVPL